jgi:hypothetical protein
MDDKDSFDPPDSFSAPPDDPHSGTRLVLAMFALPLVCGAVYGCYRVASEVAAGLMDWDTSRKVGYVGGLLGGAIATYLAVKIVQTFSQPAPLTPEQEEEQEPDDYDLPADWEED